MNDDAISRQAVLKLLYALPPEEATTKAMLIQNVKQMDAAQPEIVRCRDCRRRKDQSGSTVWLPCRAIVTPSDFSCCHAERITDGFD